MQAKWIVLLGITALTACDEAPVITDPPFTIAGTRAADQRELAKAGRITRGVEDEILRLEEFVPGLDMVLCADKVSGAAAGRGDSGAPVFVAMGPNASEINPLGILFSTTNQGTEYCTSNCVYSFSRWSRVQMFLQRPY